SLPKRLPTHRPLISWMDTCSRLVTTIGRENEPSCLAIGPSVKFFNSLVPEIVTGPIVTHRRFARGPLAPEAVAGECYTRRLCVAESNNDQWALRSPGDLDTVVPLDGHDHVLRHHGGEHRLQWRLPRALVARCLYRLADRSHPGPARCTADQPLCPQPAEE